jgi:hypothetical protein
MTCISMNLKVLSKTERVSFPVICFMFQKSFVVLLSINICLVRLDGLVEQEQWIAESTGLFNSLSFL